MNIKNIVLPLLLLIVQFACGTQEKKEIEKPFEREIEPKQEVKVINSPKVKVLSQEALSLIAQITDTIRNCEELDGYELYTHVNTFCVKGDFFDDNVEDYALLLKKGKAVKLCFIDYGPKTIIRILGTKQEWDSLQVDDYSWVGQFQLVPKGEVLWSNYIDDFRSFEDVPENEKISLSYDALFIHASESCGGAYIFWKNNKFNWLQQE